MSNTKKAKIGTSNATFIPKNYEWGLYFWRLPGGHLFHDGDGNLLNIPAMKHDLAKIAELRKAAAHYGQPEGEPWFYPGIRRATDEEYSEQKDRMLQGLIPSKNDLGAIIAAKQTLDAYGDEG